MSATATKLLLRWPSVRWRDAVLEPASMTNDELLAEATHLRDIHGSLSHPLSRESVAHRNRVLVTELRSRGDNRGR